MVKKFSRRGVCATGAAALLASRLQASAAAPLTPYPTQPYDTANGEWKTYGGNLSSWRYSALDQINAIFADPIIGQEFQADEEHFLDRGSVILIKCGLVDTGPGDGHGTLALTRKIGELE